MHDNSELTLTMYGMSPERGSSTSNFTIGTTKFATAGSLINIGISSSESSESSSSQLFATATKASFSSGSTKSMISPSLSASRKFHTVRP